MISTAARLAVRNLGRNRRRTILSIAGVGVGVAIVVFITGWFRGAGTMIVTAAAESGVGHVRVAPAGWTRTRDDSLRLPGWHDELERLRARPDVAIAAPRARAEALLGMGNRVSGVELTGVDPVEEPKLDRLVRTMTRGRYLDPGERGTIVLGGALARHLGADLDDDLVATAAAADGTIQSSMLRVVGIVETGTAEADAMISQVPLADVEELTGAPGAAEITLLLRDPARVDAVAGELAAALAPNEAVTWHVLSPDVSRDLELHEAERVLIIMVVSLLVVLGVASAQLTAVLERRHEFAVLLALGMRGAAVARQLLGEAVVLGVLGAAAGLGIAFPVLHWLNASGIDLAIMFGEQEGEQGLSFGNVLFSTVLRPDDGAWMISQALLLSLLAAVIASLYPIWFATRTDPADALRTAQ